GKYQVMGANIPQWTQQHLGQRLTPEQFLQNPQAQDAVFNKQFGQYVQQYGSPEAAARAWFAGPRGMNNPNARDQLGTSVQDYSNKFTAAMPPDAAIPPNATLTQGAVPRPDNVPPPMPRTQPMAAPPPPQAAQ